MHSNGATSTARWRDDDGSARHECHERGSHDQQRSGGAAVEAGRLGADRGGEAVTTSTLAQEIVDFVNNITTAMGVTPEVAVTETLDGIRVDVNGEGAEALLFQRGEALRALQTAVLRQEPVLEWTVAAPQPVAVPTPRTRPRRQPTAAQAPGWPMVWRDDQLAALGRLLDLAESGQRAFASLVGDPGIGKSRLAGELAALAEERGIRVLVGRCSQDEGAPPLWPWISVLGELDHELPTTSDHDQVSQFAVWEGIVAAVLEAADDQPLLLILDDLHWADVSSLRVLRLLIESDRPHSLVVLSTWRSHPPPTGALGDVAEMLARAHAVRIELTGLSADQAADVVERLVESRPTAQPSTWWIPTSASPSGRSS